MKPEEDFVPRLRQRFHHQVEIEIAVGHVDRQAAAAAQACEIKLKSLAREQVDGDGVVGESVEHHGVEGVGRLGGEAQAAIAVDHVGGSGGVRQEVEVMRCRVDHRRVDFVEAEEVAGAPVGGESAGAEADDGDAAVGNPERGQQPPDARLEPVIGGGRMRGSRARGTRCRYGASRCKGCGRPRHPRRYRESAWCRRSCARWPRRWRLRSGSCRRYEGGDGENCEADQPAARRDAIDQHQREKHGGDDADGQFQVAGE